MAEHQHSLFDDEPTPPVQRPAPDADPKKALFDFGRPYLIKSGLGKVEAGRIIGRWLKDFDADQVLHALTTAHAEDAIDPVAYARKLLVEQGERSSWEDWANELDE